MTTLSFPQVLDSALKVHGSLPVFNIIKQADDLHQDESNSLS